MPLTDKRTRKENFIERNRRARIERAIRLTRNPKGDRPPPRRSSRLQRLADVEDSGASDSDQSSAHSDCSMRSTGSGVAKDDSDAEPDEAAPDSDSNSREEKAIQAVVEEGSEDGDDEDFVVRRKRTKPRSCKRPPAGKNLRSSGRLRNKRKPTQNPSMDFLGRCKKSDRKRTDPNSVFESPETFLTAEERRESPDALVKQTADIARDLNAAGATEKERDEAAAYALAAGGTGRVVKRKTA